MFSWCKYSAKFELLRTFKEIDFIFSCCTHLCWLMVRKCSIEAEHQLNYFHNLVFTFANKIIVSIITTKIIIHLQLFPMCTDENGAELSNRIVAS